MSMTLNVDFLWLAFFILGDADIFLQRLLFHLRVILKDSGYITNDDLLEKVAVSIKFLHHVIANFLTGLFLVWWKSTHNFPLSVFVNHQLQLIH